MWRFTKSNGPSQGFHSKMEMMSRRAYGFRNFENYRLRVIDALSKRPLALKIAGIMSVNSSAFRFFKHPRPFVFDHQL